jgi:hypothetical protein
MSKMNYKQIEHCQMRLSRLRGSKVGKSPSAPADIDEDAFLRSVADGTRRIQPAVLREACESKLARGSSNYYDLEDALIAVVYKTDNAKALKIFDAREVKFKALCARVDQEITRIEDEIVLGDQQAAMALIKAFEVWRP